LGHGQIRRLERRHSSKIKLSKTSLLSIHHATAHTFTSTPAVKIIENNLGKADVRNVLQPVQIIQAAPTW
jgi:hypothetical protein